MKPIVVDANVVFAAFVRDGAIRSDPKAQPKLGPHGPAAI